MRAVRSRSFHWLKKLQVLACVATACTLSAAQSRAVTLKYITTAREQTGRFARLLSLAPIVLDAQAQPAGERSKAESVLQMACPIPGSGRSRLKSTARRPGR